MKGTKGVYYFYIDPDMTHGFECDCVYLGLNNLEETGYIEEDGRVEYKVRGFAGTVGKLRFTYG